MLDSLSPERWSFSATSVLRERGADVVM